jgi:hypothetical protein
MRLKIAVSVVRSRPWAPSLLFKILCLFAALLMPFGMHMAEAAPTHHHGSAAAMDHCAGHSGKQESGQGAITCSILCAAALPDAAAVAETPLANREHAVPSAVASLIGRLPDIAAPPPRLA